MIEALVSAVLLGGVNTIADVATAALKLDTRPIYPFARTLLVCYIVGGLVGMRTKQLLIGSLSGLLIGTFIGPIHYVLAPSMGFGAVAIAWLLFWLAFALLEAVLGSSGGLGVALARGAAAAVLSGAVYMTVTGAWPEPAPRDPDLLRALAVWTAAFFPGFVALFWSNT